MFAPARPQLSRGLLLLVMAISGFHLVPQTLSIGELGGAFSGLGLGLCGLATAALMPLINRLLWQALRGLHFGGKNARHARRRTSLERRLDGGVSSPLVIIDVFDVAD